MGCVVGLLQSVLEYLKRVFSASNRNNLISKIESLMIEADSTCHRLKQIKSIEALSSVDW